MHAVKCPAIGRYSRLSFRERKLKQGSLDYEQAGYTAALVTSTMSPHGGTAPERQSRVHRASYIRPSLETTDHGNLVHSPQS